MNAREWIDKYCTFRKRQGRALTVKRFIGYVRNLVILDILGVLAFFFLDPATALLTLLILMLVMGIFAIYSILSLRLRKCEERIETGRYV